MAIDPKTGAIIEAQGGAPKPNATGKQFVTTKYGTKIDVTGLNPQQQQQVLSVAQDKGAYGTRGATLAKQLQTQASKTPNKTVKGNPKNNYGVDPSTGQIDPNKAMGEAPKIYTTGDFQKELEKSRDAQYNYITKDYASQKSFDIEGAKQELANRGIPFDPDPNSLYGRTLHQKEADWNAKYSDATNQAILAGNEAVTGFTTANTGAYNAFWNGILGMSDADLKKYGIDKDFAAKMAAVNASRARSSGGGGSDTTPVIGGNAPGFGV